MAGKAKSFVSDNPEMLAKWDYEKNAELGIYPEETSGHSHKTVYWKCEYGHSYDCDVNHVANGAGCPICCNRRIIKGINDFGTLYPDLLLEYSKENSISPYELAPHSDVIVKWDCSICGHTYEAKIDNRVRGKGCPECAKYKRVITRLNNTAFENSLAYCYPNIAKYYDTANPYPPEKIPIGSNKKYIWICELCGGKYVQYLNNRIHGKCGCKNCKIFIGTSLPEQIIYFYLSKVIDTVNRAIVEGEEIDIYIPSKKIGIEYNGYLYHKNRKLKDSAKIDKLSKLGITIVTIQEQIHNCDYNDTETLLNYKYDIKHSYMSCLMEKICRYINVPIPDINVERDIYKIKTWRVQCVKENSFGALYPELAETFDYSKNGFLSPYQFLPHSGIRVWWKWDCGHSYKLSFDQRTKANGCRICSGWGESRQRYTKDNLDEISRQHILMGYGIPKVSELKKYNLPCIATYRRHYIDWREPFYNAYEQLQKS